jgi:hypothetical protein
MKKILSIALVATLVFGALVAPAAAGKKKKKKKVAPPYTTVLTYTRPAIGSGGTGLGTEALNLSSTDTHIYATIEIADDVSPTGNITLGWDTDGDTVADQAITVCGATEGSIEVPASTTFTVFPWILPSPACPTGFSTMGTITATFSSKP